MARLMCHDARIGSLGLIWFWWCSHADSISVFGRFWSPHVISAYYTPFSKSCRFFTLVNAFLRLRRKKAWDGKKFPIFLPSKLISSDVIAIGLYAHSRNCDNLNSFFSGWTVSRLQSKVCQPPPLLTPVWLCDYYIWRNLNLEPSARGKTASPLYHPAVITKVFKRIYLTAYPPMLSEQMVMITKITSTVHGAKHKTLSFL